MKSVHPDAGDGVYVDRWVRIGSIDSRQAKRTFVAAVHRVERKHRPIQQLGVYRDGPPESDAAVVAHTCVSWFFTALRGADAR